MTPRNASTRETARQVRDFGTWPSPISAADVATAAVSYSLPRCDGPDVLWSERRPREAARVAIVRRRPDGTASDVIAAPFSARSKVHEYGGGHFAARAGRVCFVNDADQDLYLVDGAAGPERLTAAPDERFADTAFDPAAGRVYTVVERRTGDGSLPQNTIAIVALAGEARGETFDLLAGRDFYASPRPSPDGRRLAWLAWDLPAMPWEAAELWVGTVDETGAVTNAAHVAGGHDDGVFQPEWDEEGALYFVAGRGGWGNLHVLRNGDIGLIAEVDADFGRPQWAFGMTSYAVLEPGRLVAAAWRNGICELGIADEASASWRPVESDFLRVDDIAAGPDLIAINGGGDLAPGRVHLIDRKRPDFHIAQSSAKGPLDAADISRARVLACDVGDETVYAMYYPPANAGSCGPEGHLPPLVVSAHGGPTAMARRGFALDRQYWTTRGFAFLDVDYRGSTGYGDVYRRSLDGAWGERDADDTVAAASFAAAIGLCDPSRMVIRGSSAGGLTVLNALIRSKIFAAGASYYGVTDLARLAADTHKFESGYLVSLIGGEPDDLPEVYEARSPVHHADRITAPVIFFQGLDDAVVPPAQSRAMVQSLNERGIAVASLEFAGEAHGFRQPETVVAALEAELAFYARILGFTPADDLPDIEIANLRE